MGRPSRPPLTREDILRTALALVDDEGPGALSTPRIAARLGVKGPSLYNHIAGREEIIDGIRELIIAEMNLDVTIRPWTAALESWARSYRAAFAAHPHTVPLLAGRPVRSLSVLDGYAQAFAILRAAGWPEEHLLPLVQSVEYFLGGSALALVDTPTGLPLPPPENLPDGLGPILNAPPDYREIAFETGLSALVRGFQATLDTLNIPRSDHRQ
ncbi:MULTISPECIES: TetR/AcrR family transcriptional regulator [unclassified Streptomyces]|uniref:TetR/AcrR family transcriptional regulator n=1 Tax=unclassified Streptomyces TaxID=2593676 RepID=UPI001BE9A27A|nr:MULTISPECIES: TetR/AcrR family transcriptional regulator C-terminal domain-containing protein [unclassified Streptomyces]MBT2408296.1 TetR/AcrR family transcriptional regulator C-terminal domain-containing protein [Streptomyces sp. ISL-21]MBT2457690.1 TetR/AcrR family transcriptional regulator C-terminal domain-containing protein [Streptomyces sp. ISL-86]MBT2607328.1 TetR/AcrR family transcriptional regulator C-terminal domain-containing protein [Streptomyces sp. ISL-87]